MHEVSESTVFICEGISSPWGEGAVKADEGWRETLIPSPHPPSETPPLPEGEGYA